MNAKEMNKLEILGECCHEYGVSFSGVESNAIIKAMESYHQAKSKEEAEEITSLCNKGLEIARRTHSGNVSHALSHFNNYFKSIIAAFGKEGEGCKCNQPPELNQTDKIITLCGRCGKRVQTEV